jgi:membrane glycosyltransferase
VYSQASQLTNRRAALWAATFATVVPLTCVLDRTLPETTPILNAFTLALFLVLTTWIALWFWISATGAWHLWELYQPNRIVLPPFAPENASPLSRTAILLPVYNEDPGPVFARIVAMLDSLKAIDHADTFDFFVLSDTRDPDIWLEEEWHWLQVQSQLVRTGRVFYRRRTNNVGCKAGNIADFCEHWGADYRFMIVLDADSLIDGEVMVELVRRMENDPQLGLLQTPTLPLCDQSLLSRCQQFSSRLCTPMLANALEWFSGDGGNYWGHNAIIRTAAFTRFCGLGELPGKPPLGGPVLSHDFVEAALMQRAGYKVRLATDLTSSYEQCPTTLPLFAERDSRWCQGNLQHARLIVSRRIPLSNRFHFATGVMAFVSSPLWMLFLLISLAARSVHGIKASLADTETFSGATSWLTFSLFAAIMFMLVAPRIWGAIIAWRDPQVRAKFGGAGAVVRSLLLEFGISVLIAPIMMAFHTLFIFSTLSGHRVQWGAQSRAESGVSLRQAWRVHRGQTMAGVVAAIAAALLAPESLFWLTPILAGLVFSVPISMAVSSAPLSAWFKRQGLLTIPEEVELPRIVQLFENARERIKNLGCPPREQLLRYLLNDPLWLRSHLAMLYSIAADGNSPPADVEQCKADIRAGRWSEISNELKQTLLVDSIALTELHHEFWISHSLQESLVVSR